ncbi:MAG: hypothetical protein HYV02_01035 [Deltaproteobacteria bacterium]|nr:hypothetical protein [Deltaproteobacteria bacterium]
METNKDFEELLAYFNDHHVEYLVIGGYAVAFHGAPRYTQDLDLYYRRSSENARSILSALHDFGFGSLAISDSDLLTQGMVVQLGQPPNRVDLINDASGIEFDAAWQTRLPGAYGNVTVFFIDKETLKHNKAVTGRHKDLADLEQLSDESLSEK